MKGLCFRSSVTIAVVLAGAAYLTTRIRRPQPLEGRSTPLTIAVPPEHLSPATLVVASAPTGAGTPPDTTLKDGGGENAQPSHGAKELKPWFAEPWGSALFLFALSLISIWIGYVTIHEPLTRLGFTSLNEVRLASQDPVASEVVILNTGEVQPDGGELPGQVFTKIDRSIGRRQGKGGKGPKALLVTSDMSPYNEGQSAQHAEGLESLQRIQTQRHIPVKVNGGRRLLGPKDQTWGSPKITLEGVSTFAGMSGHDYPLDFAGPNGPIRSLAKAAVEEATKQPISPPYGRSEKLDKMRLGSGAHPIEGMYIPEGDYSRVVREVKVITLKPRADGFLLSEEEEKLLDGKYVIVGPAYVKSEDQGRVVNGEELGENEARMIGSDAYTQAAAICGLLNGLERFPPHFSLSLEVFVCASLIAINAIAIKKAGRPGATTAAKNGAPHRPRWVSLIPWGSALLLLLGSVGAAKCGYIFDPFLGLITGFGIEAAYAHPLVHILFGHGESE